MPDGGRAAGLGRWTVALWSLLSFPASAQLPSQITIDWTGSQQCPRSSGLEGEIARLLGPSPPVAEPTKFVARVDELADRTLNYYRLTLTVSSESRHAERSVELATCSDVSDAAALLIASAIDPNAVLRAKPPPPAPPPPPKEPEPAPEPAGPFAPARWSLRVLGQLDTRSLPEVTGGPILGALLQEGHYRAWADVRYLVPRTAQSPDVENKLSLYSAALGGAYVWPLGKFVLGPVLEAEVGLLHSVGKSRNATAEGRNDSTVTGIFSFGALAAYAVDRRVGVELALLAGVPVRRAQLQVVGEDKPYYTTDPVTMRLALGLRVSLGSP